jgi:thioredoxin reductase
MSVSHVSGMNMLADLLIGGVSAGWTAGLSLTRFNRSCVIVDGSDVTILTPFQSCDAEKRRSPIVS